ncbi:DUF3466 family protein [Microseira sp. BLCC-F43]|uniref:DUF3466 family protein n=1 Tax=Microseira sp. BLCC-F43 TaxID=3153602 RepID=UPI0035BAD914
MMKILNTCKVGMALIAAAFLGIATSQRADAISFYLTDVGTLGGNNSYATDINEYGQVVGTSYTADGQSRAFLWDNSSGMTNLGTLPSNYNYCYNYGYGYGSCYSSSSSNATAINDYGQVIGNSSTTYYGGYYGGYYEQNLFFFDKSSGMIRVPTPGGGYRSISATAINNYGQVIGNIYDYYGLYPFFWEKSSGITYLGTASGYFDDRYSSASAINNYGQVVGTSSGYYSYYGGYLNYRQYPFLWEKSSGMIDLGSLGGNYGRASAINDLGQVVGTSYTADGLRRAFLWEKSSGMIDLGTLGGNYGYASAINDLGQVIGYSTTADGLPRAFFWDKSSGMINLGTLGGYDSYPTAINNYGQVIGYSTTADGQYRPFFWDNSTGMSDLNDLVSAPGWILNNVVGINNAGQIVGNGSYNGQSRAFVLTPKSVPEPSSTLAFLTLGAVGAGAAFRQRQQQEASSRN